MAESKNEWFDLIITPVPVPTMLIFDYALTC